MKRIGVLTSGGDAPGMNAAIRAVVRSAIYHGLEVRGIAYGYAGLMSGQVIEMPAGSVSGIVNRGGTILHSARAEEFKTQEGQRRALEVLRQNGIEGIVTIGGNGSVQGAQALWAEWGFPVAHVASTIDNDLPGTDFSIGFDTAINTALEALDRIRDTADAHDRIFVVEVMGRDRGEIAVHVGLAAGAEVVIIPEIPYQPVEVGCLLKRGGERGKRSSIIVVAEGAARALAVAADMADITGYEVRTVVLGHLQRGGSPTAADRILASRLGEAAVKALIEGRFGQMAGVINNEVVYTPLDQVVVGRPKLEVDLYELARVLAT